MRVGEIEGGRGNGEEGGVLALFANVHKDEDDDEALGMFRFTLAGGVQAMRLATMAGVDGQRLWKLHLGDGVAEISSWCNNSTGRPAGRQEPGMI